MSARAVAGAAALALGAAAAHLVADRRDRAAVRRDPRRTELDPAALPPAEVLDVRSADGTALHVRVWGPADAPVVVLAHGWTCTADYWVPQVSALAADHRVVAYDQRGHGRSATGSDVLLGPDQLADDLAAVLDATVPRGRRALLVGHSMGAMGIVAWADRHPDQLRRIAAATLLASTGVGDTVADSLLVPVPLVPAKVRAALTRAFLGASLPIGPRGPLTFRGVRYVALSRAASPAQVALCERMILGCPTDARARWATAMDEMDLTPALRRLTVPTSVLVGLADRLTPPVYSRRIADAAPRLERLVELPEVGHMSTLEAPAAVNAEIRRLVRTHVSGALAEASA